MNIAQLARQSDQTNTAAALDDYRRLLQKSGPDADDVRRFKDVCRILQISDEQVRADQQALKDVAGLTRAVSSEEQLDSMRHQRADAAPAAIAALADIVRQAIIESPSVGHAEDAVRRILSGCNWLNARMPELIRQIHPAVQEYHALPDPRQTIDADNRRMQDIAAIKRENPRLFADATTHN